MRKNKVLVTDIVASRFADLVPGDMFRVINPQYDDGVWMVLGNLHNDSQAVDLTDGMVGIFAKTHKVSRVAVVTISEDK